MTMCRRSPGARLLAAPTRACGRRAGMSAIGMPASSPVLAEVLERAADPENWERFERQLRSSGYCRRPVPPRGRVDSLHPARAPGGVLPARGGGGGGCDLVPARAGAGRDAAEVLRQPARGGLPVVRA